MTKKRPETPTSPLARAAGILSLTLLAWSQNAAGAESVTVVSWGGSYARSYTKAVLQPFTAATGIEVRLEDYNGGLAQIRAQVETGNVHWDVVDLEMADAVLGCDEGLLEPIDAGDLPPGPDGTPAEQDFFPETLTECGIGVVFYPRSTPTTRRNSLARSRPPSATSSTWRSSRAGGECAGPRGQPGVRVDGGWRADQASVRHTRNA